MAPAQGVHTLGVRHMAAVPPTCLGSSRVGQPQIPRIPAQVPSQTQFGQIAAAQAKPEAGSGHRTIHAPPPTRYGTAPAQPKAATATARAIHQPPQTFYAADAIQPYQVLGADKLYGAMPAKRPWLGYPYAVVTGAQLEAQQRRLGVAGEDAFLDAGNINLAHVQGHGGGMSLRVSDDCRMAIEDSDLAQRQPKTFFLTAGLLAESNQALQAAGSEVRLQTTGQTITVLTGWWRQEVLQGVTARYEGHLSPNDLSQNCNDIAAKVSGNSFTTNRGSNQTLDARQGLSGAVGGIMSENQVRSYVRTYSDAASRDESSLSDLYLNQFADPGIGESYMISTIEPASRRQVVDEELFHLQRRHRNNELWWWERRRMANLQRELRGLPQDVPNMNPVQTVMDYETGQNRALGWPYHFGGVVVKSGSDVVTLENYARGDNRQGGGDPRWYFQMYGQAKSGQSFHEAHKAQQAYSNPMTIAVRR